MALVLSRVTHLRDSMVRIKDESRSAAACTREDTIPNVPVPLQTYFEAAMRQFQQKQRKQARQSVYSSQAVRLTSRQKTYVPDVEMASVESRQYRSDAYYLEGDDTDDSGQDDLRRPLVAATVTTFRGRISALRIEMSVIADEKEFNGKDRDESKAKRWISNV